MGDGLAVNYNFHRKQFLVVRAGLVRNDVIGDPKMLRLQLLLKRRLEVHHLSPGVFNVFNLRFEKSQHHATGFFNTVVEIDRSNDSFESIDQECLLGAAARLLFTSSQLQVPAQMDPLRVFHQIRGTHEEPFQF